MEHTDKSRSGALLWCALCRLVFFATGSEREVWERAEECGWEFQSERLWCEECAKPYRGAPSRAVRKR